MKFILTQCCSGQSTARYTKTILLAALLVALSACGGGGGGDDGSDNLPDTVLPGDDDVNDPADIDSPVDDDINDPLDIDTPVNDEITDPPDIDTPIDDDIDDSLDMDLPVDDDVDDPLDIDTPTDDGDIGSVENTVEVGGSTECNVTTQRQWAYNALQDYYLFADQVPDVDPQVYDSAADVVRQLRFEERDPYSGVSNATTSALRFDEGMTFGPGYRWGFDDEGNPRVLQVHAASPFGLAGIERGDIPLTVDGLQWDDQVLADTFAERVIGTPENPATSSWRIGKRDTGEIVDIEITSAQYLIDTVMRTNVYTNTEFDGRIGYLLFGSFLDTSAQELLNAAAYFQEQDITELVLDLRYNGGGRVSIAGLLASLIGGSERSGQTLYEYQYNDRYSVNNSTLEFAELINQPGLSRLIVLTTQATASASEIVISGLQPYIDVVTIGEATSGKPYISSAVDRCGERLDVMEAEGTNANGSSVFGGIEPVCFAADDRTRDFDYNPVTDEIEGFLRAGLDYVVLGTCNTQPAVIANSPSPRSVLQSDESGRQGMTQGVGAFAY